MRRILATLLAMSVIVAVVPSAASADDATQPTSKSPRPSVISRHAAALDLGNATRGVLLQKAPGEGGAKGGSLLKSPKGKGTFAAAIVAAAVVVAFKASQGPDPTPATAR
jgi:hypothetical protein